MSTLITRMRMYREKLGMSQNELAEKVGVRRETIVRLEKGQYNPSLKLAVDISKEFEIGVDEIFQFLDEEKEEVKDKSEISELKRNRKTTEVYVISADTYHERYGTEIELFGVCDTLEKAEKIAEELRREGEIPQIDKVRMNQKCWKYLGGYYE